MKPHHPSLMPLLRSDVQGRILARLLEDPDAEHTLTALATFADTSFPTAQREVRRAEEAGMVTTRRLGQARLARANPDHPLHEHLRAIVVSTFGVPAVVARCYSELRGADAVLLFGSWAARYVGEPGRAPNDVDVLVIGEPDRYEADDCAATCEAELDLPVQTTVRTRSQWDDADESFIREVRSRPLTPVLVAEGLTLPDKPPSGTGQPST